MQFGGVPVKPRLTETAGSTMNFEQRAEIKPGNCEIDPILRLSRMGVFHKPRQISPGRLVATEILATTLSPDSSLVKRLRRESRVLEKQDTHIPGTDSLSIAWGDRSDAGN